MRSGLEGAPLGKELAGWMLLISSGDLMFSCLHPASLGVMGFTVLWGGCELARRKEISVPSVLCDPLSSRKLQLWEDQEIRDCFLSELASVFPKSAALSVLLHPQHRFGSLPRTSAVSAPGEPLSITRDHPKQPAASGAARGLRCVQLASGFKKEEVNIWKSSRTASPLLTPLAPRCPGATSISVPFFQSYLKANHFCSGAGAPPASCSQPGDLIPCLVLSLGRLLWCTEQGLHDLCPDEVLTSIVPTVTVTSF